MFRLRPSRQWQNKSAGVSAPPAKTFAAQIMALFGLKKAPDLRPQRRASDALGLRSATALGPQAGLLMTEANRAQSSEAPEPMAEREIGALEMGAGSLTADMEQSDRLLLSLQAQMMMGDNLQAIQKQTNSTFAHIDQELERWSLRANDLERSMIRPEPTPGLFSSSGPAQRLRRWLHLPGRQPAPAGDNRVANRVQQHRLSLSAPRQLPRLAALPMRAQINLLAQKPPAQKRPMAMLAAQLHERIDHIAHELHLHRHDKGAKAEGQKDRRQKNRPSAGLPPPILKPKVRQDEQA
jgi:hypothetical protein